MMFMIGVRKRALFYRFVRVINYGVIFLAELSISALLMLILTQAGLLITEKAGKARGSNKVAISLMES